MTTPSKLGEGNTKEHDELLLWISENPEVIHDFIEPILGKFYNKNTSFKVIQGHPVVSINGYLHGKIDTIIETHIEYTQSSKQGASNILENVVALIVDATPKLNHISADLDQINAYTRLLDFDRDYKDMKNRVKVIVTIDTNGKFDSMLANQGIYVYHVHNGDCGMGCYRCGASGMKPFLIPMVGSISQYDQVGICDICREYVEGYDINDSFLTECDYCHKKSDWTDEISDYTICNDCCDKDICQKCGMEIGKNEEQFEGDGYLPTMWLCEHCYYNKCGPEGPDQ